LDASWRRHNPFGRLRDYELRHLVLDLEERGPHEKLHRVFLLEDARGRNAWYEAKTAVGAGAAYLSDLERAWAVLKEENRQRVAQGGSPDLATEFRYALTAAVLGSVETRPPWLVVESARHGLWTPEEAVSFALQERSWSRRAMALTELGCVLDGNWRLAAQKAALTTLGEDPGEARNRTSASSDPDPGGSSRAERRLAAECLGRLAPALADPLIPVALESAKNNGGLWYFHSMKAVVRRLPDPQRETEADSLWQAANSYSATYWKVEAAAVTAPLAVAEARAARIAEAARLAVDVLGDEQARRFRLEDPFSGALLIASSPLLIRREDLRALNEIAPHLSLKQLKDALARVAALPPEMQDAARSVLLPQLARLRAVNESLAAIGAMKSAYFRGLARAAVLEFAAAPRGASRQWIWEAGSLEDREQRVLCRAALARVAGAGTRAAVIASVIRDVRKMADEMQLPALLDLAPAFGGLPARERVPLVNRALELALAGFANTVVLPELVSCALAAHLDRKAVAARHRGERGVEIGHTAEEIRAKMRSAVRVKAIDAGPGGAGGLPMAGVAEALKRINSLAAATHSRAIALAAQFAGAADLDVLAQAAAGIRTDYARSFAWLALTQRAAEARRPAFAIELLRTLLHTSGGFSGAEPFFRTAAGALGPMRSETYQECSAFAASLAQESIGTALEELAPSAAVFQWLSGAGELDGIAKAVGLVDRWWGKRTLPPEESETHGKEGRFEWQPLPATPQECAFELLTILPKGKEFDAAIDLLKDMAAAGWESAAESAWSTLVAECAAAGELDRCALLLTQRTSVPPETAGAVARAYIRYGRIEDAFELLSKGISWPVAFPIIEALGAEDKWPDALMVFEGMVLRPLPAEACEDFANSCFVVGNGVFKTKDEKLLDRFLDAASAIRFAEGVGEEVRARLNEYASGLETRGYIGRAEAWRKLAGVIG
jgi:hypothetical protein